MKRLIALSRCLGSERVRKSGIDIVDLQSWRKECCIFIFHFKGFYDGKEIKQIRVYSKKRFIKGKNYIIDLEYLHYDNKHLVCREIKSRDLDDIRLKI